MEASRADEMRAGQMLSHYRVIEKLGAGGMGVVYRAHDEQLDRDIAIKVLPAGAFSDPAARTRLLREARMAAALNHPHVCTIHEVGEANGQIYIAMECVAGQPLNRMIPAGGMTVNDLLRYGLQIADAVRHAHERGIVHRDLKAANTLVTPQGRAKVLDFGLARRASVTELAEATTANEQPTEAEAIVGTLPYMAPEQLRGAAPDARSDVWALGVMLYEMASGVRPFQGHTGFELSSAILNQCPAPLPDRVSPEMRTVIGRCLEKEPERRYQRAGEVCAALETIQTHAAPQSSPRTWRVLAAVLFGAVVLGVGWWALPRPAGPPPRIESLVVLPLKNLTGDPSQDYFVDGMTEALITTFSRIGTLSVISSTSAMQYKNTSKTPPQIAQELGGIDALVEGTVQRSGNQLLVTVGLVHAATNRIIETVKFERDVADVFALYSDIAQNVARVFSIAISAPERARLADSRRPDPEAYDAYLLGRRYWNQRSQTSLKRAVAYFEQATARDPTFAEAYAALADTYVIMDIYSDVSPKEVQPKAKALALKALDIDPTLGEAQATLGWIAFTYDFDWQAAEERFSHALQLNPGYATGRHWYAIYLSAMGHFDQAKREMTRALELDPNSPVIFTQTGFPYFAAGEIEAAMNAYNKAAAKFPDFQGAHTNLARSLVLVGAYEQALSEIRLAEPRACQGLLGMAYGLLGRITESRQVLDQLAAKSRETHVPAIDYVYVYIGLGDNERALDWLERAYEERGIFIAWLKTWPLFDRLREEPRFKKLLARMKLSD